MQLEEIGKDGTTNPRKRFWDLLPKIILASQKREGKYVSVDVYDGQGSVVSIPQDERGRPGGAAATGACCHVDGSCEIDTESHCLSTDGEYQGDDTTCEDEDIDCTHTGACCNDGDCAIKTQAHCEDSGGVYQGDGTDCDPNPCEMVDCTCGYDAFDGSGRKFLTKTQNITQSASSDCSEGCNDGNIASASSSGTRTLRIDPDTCEESCISGSGHASGTYCDSTPDCDMDFGCVAFPSDCGGCNDNHTTDIETTATVVTITETWSSSCCSQNKVTQSILSEECNPI